MNETTTLWVIGALAVAGVLFMLKSDVILGRLIAGGPSKKTVEKSREEAPKREPLKTDSRTIALGILAIVVLAHLAFDLLSRKRTASAQRIDDLANEVDDLDSRVQRLERR